MSTFFWKLQYHTKRILFEQYGLPPVVNEHISKAVLKKYLRRNPVVIDCGAHDGSDSVSLAKQFRYGTVHAFEPVPGLYNRLQQNARTISNIRCYPIALADQNGILDFYMSEGGSDASSSLLEPKEHLHDHPDTFFSKTMSVQAKTLDTWAEENNIPKVDLLWLDMQGFEFNMLQASKKIIDTVSVIHTEVSLEETYKDVALFNEYRAFLESKGFVLQIEAIPQGWNMGNALFVRKKQR
ncbi:MAG: noeI 2 [Ferruginibacter sp.]|nr:noeI 2 [Ferruginibacter sp.]